jgi:predicted RNA-binding protein with PIN domain
MPFVIDGYNLLHAMGVLGGPVGPHQLAKARTRLIALISPAHAIDLVTIVFDARRASPGMDETTMHGPVRVEFAVGEEADDRIERLIAGDSAPKKLVIVSDDHRLQQAARRRGCSAWKCGEYLTWLEKRRDQPRQVAPEKPPSVLAADADRWAAEFADLDRDPAWEELFGPFDEFDEGAGI